MKVWYGYSLLDEVAPIGVGQLSHILTKKEVQLKLKSNRGERWLSRQKLFKSLHVKSQLRKRRNEKRDIAIAPFMMD